MNAKNKKIVAANFKADANLKKQFIFEDGYCFFLESAAKERAAAKKIKYETVVRDAKAEKLEEDNSELLEKLEEELQTTKEMLLDASDEAEKKVLEGDIAKIEEKIEALK